MLRPKRKISAKALAIDVIAGADDHALMTKYRLAPKKLNSLLKKLLEAEIISETDLAMREFSGAGVLCPECDGTNPSHYNFCCQCGAELTWRCSECGGTSPRSAKSCTACGAPATGPNGFRNLEVVEKTHIPEGGKDVVVTRLLRDIRSGFGYHALLSKYGLSPGGFETLSNWLLRTGVITHSQMERIDRSRSGPVCPKCGSSNSSQHRFCGNCGCEVGEPSENLTTPTLSDAAELPDSLPPLADFEEIPETTSQKAARRADENRFIQELKSAVSNVLSPLRKIARSRKRINRAFYQACRAGEIGKVFYLLDAGADVDGDEVVPGLHAEKPRGGQARLHPLGVSAKNGREDVVMLLLEKGADVDKRGGADLTTALMETRSALVAQALLDHGADIDAVDLRGYTALMAAASDGCVDVVRLLLSRGSNVNVSNADGETALMCAAQHNPPRNGEPPGFDNDYSGVVKMLLENGADLSLTNKNGFTALQLADDCGYQDIVDILREAGASEPLVEIDDNILTLVTSMIRTRLNGSGRYSRDMYSGISSARKSIRLSNARFFLSVSMLANMARIDGGPNRAELSCLRRFMRDSPWNNRVKIAEDIFHDRSDTSRNSNAIAAAFMIDVGAFLRLFRDHEMHIRTIENELIVMATADGPVNRLEEHLLDLFVGEVARNTSGEHCRSSDSGGDEGYDPEKIAACYGTLKCSETDSDEYVRSRYRQLVKEYHPDSIQGKELPEDFISYANKRFREIQESYKIVMDHRKNRGTVSPE